VRARANFECKRCCTAKGDPNFKIVNLPIDSQRCPLCGAKRGFKRLFDAINVSSRHSPHKHRYIDRQMEGPMLHHDSVKDGVKRFKKLGKEAMERAWEKTPGDGREVLAAKHPEAVAAMRNGTVGHALPAQMAMGAVPPAARMDSRQYTYSSAVGRPAPLTGHATTDAMQGVQNRQVRPDWQRGGRK